MKRIVVTGDTPYLAEEIILEILKRLPVKSLIRFRSVCKHWKNLFKTPSFTAQHLQHSNNHNPSILFRRGSCGDPLQLCLYDCKMQIREVLKPPLIDRFSSAAIVSTSNGLVCVNLDKRCHGRSPPPLLLWNPATREVKHVPKNINDSEGTFFMGFGFSPIINDYKIVMLSVSGLVVHRAEVYSLTSGCWKELECGSLAGIENFRRITVTANGVMFWLGFGWNWRCAEDFIIVSFDMATEVFTLIPMPELGPTLYATLTVHEDRLAMLCVEDSIDNFVNLCVMEEPIGSSSETWVWSETCTGLSLPSLTRMTIFRNQILFGVVHEPANGGSTIVLLNLTTNELKEDFIHECDVSCGVFNYVESLVPVEGMKFAIST